MAIYAFIGDTPELPGDNVALALPTLGSVAVFTLKADIGYCNGEAVTINAVVDTAVSRDGINYAASIIFTEGEITNAGVDVYVKRTAVTINALLNTYAKPGIALAPLAPSVSVHLINTSDVTAPMLTGQLTLVPSGHEITLDWTDGADNTVVAGYEIEYGTDVNYGMLTTSAISAKIITGLASSTTYYFRVRAYDAAGNKSGWITGSAATPAFSGGTGTELDPYLIGTVAEWNTVPSSNAYASKHFALKSNLDAGNANLSCWYWHDGTSQVLFTGTLNGRGYTLSNAKAVPTRLAGGNSYTTFIHNGDNAVKTLPSGPDAVIRVKNIRLLNCTAASTYPNADTSARANMFGLIALDNVTAENCTSTSENHYAYGLASAGQITNCKVINPTVIASSSSTYKAYAMGLTLYGDISNTYVQGGTITGWNASGFVANATAGRIIKNCYSRGVTITASGDKGAGFVANRDASNSGTIVNCYAANTLSGTAVFLHGFSGADYNNGADRANFWDTSLTGASSTATSNVAGLATSGMQSTSAAAGAIGNTTTGLPSVDGSGKWSFSAGSYPTLVA